MVWWGNEWVNWTSPRRSTTTAPVLHLDKQDSWVLTVWQVVSHGSSVAIYMGLPSPIEFPYDSCSSVAFLGLPPDHLDMVRGCPWSPAVSHVLQLPLNRWLAFLIDTASHSECPQEFYMLSGKVRNFPENTAGSGDCPIYWTHRGEPLVTGISNLMASLHRFSFLLHYWWLDSGTALSSLRSICFRIWPIRFTFDQWSQFLFVAFHERNEIIASVCGSTWKSISNGKWGCLPTDVTSRNERMADVTRHHWLRQYFHNPSISFSMEDGIYLVIPSIITPGYTYWPTRRLVFAHVATTIPERTHLQL